MAPQGLAANYEVAGRVMAASDASAALKENMACTRRCPRLRVIAQDAERGAKREQDDRARFARRRPCYLPVPLFVPKLLIGTRALSMPRDRLLTSSFDVIEVPPASPSSRC